MILIFFLFFYHFFSLHSLSPSSHLSSSTVLDSFTPPPSIHSFFNPQSPQELQNFLTQLSDVLNENFDILEETLMEIFIHMIEMHMEDEEDPLVSNTFAQLCEAFLSTSSHICTDTSSLDSPNDPDLFEDEFSDFEDMDESINNHFFSSLESITSSSLLEPLMDSPFDLFNQTFEQTLLNSDKKGDSEWSPLDLASQALTFLFLIKQQHFFKIKEQDPTIVTKLLSFIQHIYQKQIFLIPKNKLENFTLHSLIYLAILNLHTPSSFFKNLSQVKYAPESPSQSEDENSEIDLSDFEDTSMQIIQDYQTYLSYIIVGFHYYLLSQGKSKAIIYENLLKFKTIIEESVQKHFPNEDILSNLSEFQQLLYEIQRLSSSPHSTYHQIDSSPPFFAPIQPTDKPSSQEDLSILSKVVSNQVFPFAPHSPSRTETVVPQPYSRTRPDSLSLPSSYKRSSKMSHADDFIYEPSHSSTSEANLDVSSFLEEDELISPLKVPPLDSSVELPSTDSSATLSEYITYISHLNSQSERKSSHTEEEGGFNYKDLSQDNVIIDTSFHFNLTSSYRPFLLETLLSKVSYLQNLEQPYSLLDSEPSHTLILIYHYLSETIIQNLDNLDSLFFLSEFIDLTFFLSSHISTLKISTPFLELYSLILKKLQLHSSQILSALSTPHISSSIDPTQFTQFEDILLTFSSPPLLDDPDDLNLQITTLLKQILSLPFSDSYDHFLTMALTSISLLDLSLTLSTSDNLDFILSSLHSYISKHTPSLYHPDYIDFFVYPVMSCYLYLGYRLDQFQYFLTQHLETLPLSSSHTFMCQYMKHYVDFHLQKIALNENHNKTRLEHQLNQTAERTLNTLLSHGLVVKDQQNLEIFFFKKFEEDFKQAGSILRTLSLFKKENLLMIETLNLHEQERLELKIQLLETILTLQLSILDDVIHEKACIEKVIDNMALTLLELHTYNPHFVLDPFLLVNIQMKSFKFIPNSYKKSLIRLLKYVMMTKTFEPYKESSSHKGRKINRIFNLKSLKSGSLSLDYHFAYTLLDEHGDKIDKFPFLKLIQIKTVNPQNQLYLQKNLPPSAIFPRIIQYNPHIPLPLLGSHLPNAMIIQKVVKGISVRRYFKTLSNHQERQDFILKLTEFVFDFSQNCFQKQIFPKNLDIENIFFDPFPPEGESHFKVLNTYRYEICSEGSSSINKSYLIKQILSKPLIEIFDLYLDSNPSNQPHFITDFHNLLKLSVQSETSWNKIDFFSLKEILSFLQKQHEYLEQLQVNTHIDAFLDFFIPSIDLINQISIPLNQCRYELFKSLQNTLEIYKKSVAHLSLFVAQLKIGILQSQERRFFKPLYALFIDTTDLHDPHQTLNLLLKMSLIFQTSTTHRYSHIFKQFAYKIVESFIQQLSPSTPSFQFFEDILLKIDSLDFSNKSSFQILIALLSQENIKTSVSPHSTLDSHLQNHYYFDQTLRLFSRHVISLVGAYEHPNHPVHTLKEVYQFKKNYSFALKKVYRNTVHEIHSLFLSHHSFFMKDIVEPLNQIIQEYDDNRSTDQPEITVIFETYLVFFEDFIQSPLLYIHDFFQNLNLLADELENYSSLIPALINIEKKLRELIQKYRLDQKWFDCIDSSQQLLISSDFKEQTDPLLTYPLFNEQFKEWLDQLNQKTSLLKQSVRALSNFEVSLQSISKELSKPYRFHDTVMTLKEALDSLKTKIDLKKIKTVDDIINNPELCLFLEHYEVPMNYDSIIHKVNQFKKMHTHFLKEQYKTTLNQTFLLFQSQKDFFEEFVLTPLASTLEQYENDQLTDSTDLRSLFEHYFTFFEHFILSPQTHFQFFFETLHRLEYDLQTHSTQIPQFNQIYLSVKRFIKTFHIHQEWLHTLVQLKNIFTFSELDEKDDPFTNYSILKKEFQQWIDDVDEKIDSLENTLQQLIYDQTQFSPKKPLENYWFYDTFLNLQKTLESLRNMLDFQKTISGSILDNPQLFSFFKQYKTLLYFNLPCPQPHDKLSAQKNSEESDLFYPNIISQFLIHLQFIRTHPDTPQNLIYKFIVKLSLLCEQYDFNYSLQKGKNFQLHLALKYFIFNIKKKEVPIYKTPETNLLKGKRLEQLRVSSTISLQKSEETEENLWHQYLEQLKNSLITPYEDCETVDNLLKLYHNYIRVKKIRESYRIIDGVIHSASLLVKQFSSPHPTLGITDFIDRLINLITVISSSPEKMSTEDFCQSLSEVLHSNNQEQLQILQDSFEPFLENLFHSSPEFPFLSQYIQIIEFLEFFKRQINISKSILLVEQKKIKNSHPNLHPLQQDSFTQNFKPSFDTSYDSDDDEGIFFLSPQKPPLDDTPSSFIPKQETPYSIFDIDLLQLLSNEKSSVPCEKLVNILELLIHDFASLHTFHLPKDLEKKVNYLYYRNIQKTLLLIKNNTSLNPTSCRDILLHTFHYTFNVASQYLSTPQHQNILEKSTHFLEATQQFLTSLNITEESNPNFLELSLKWIENSYNYIHFLTTFNKESKTVASNKIHDVRELSDFVENSLQLKKNSFSFTLFSDFMHNQNFKWTQLSYIVFVVKNSLMRMQESRYRQLKNAAREEKDFSSFQFLENIKDFGHTVYQFNLLSYTWDNVVMDTFRKIVFLHSSNPPLQLLSTSLKNMDANEKKSQDYLIKGHEYFIQSIENETTEEDSLLNVIIFFEQQVSYLCYQLTNISQTHFSLPNHIHTDIQIFHQTLEFILKKLSKQSFNECFSDNFQEHCLELSQIYLLLEIHSTFLSWQTLSLLSDIQSLLESYYNFIIKKRQPSSSLFPEEYPIISFLSELIEHFKDPNSPSYLKDLYKRMIHSRDSILSHPIVFQKNLSRIIRKSLIVSRSV